MAKVTFDKNENDRINDNQNNNENILSKQSIQF